MSRPLVLLDADGGSSGPNTGVGSPGSPTDLAGQDDIRSWMRREVICLLVAPEPAYGLTAAHLDSVDTFLRG